MTQRLTDDFDLGILSHEYTLWRKDGGGKLRFGQRIWNLYGLPGKSWPELYYQEDPVEAYSMLAAEAWDMWAKRAMNAMPVD